ncbi:DUF3857 domain-containing protein [Winogradskyella ursingii]|uniref:DUF3857 domain-containing protein n=1 Tax=Winogradskyella ursingii TaxID=2686079 RepID=UPI0015CC267A|nr:DUF3857 domain-containing protein [Winogradskyella ursingii]
MKNLYITMCLLFSTTIINAQDYKFGKVSEVELAETVHPLDSSANAAILYKEETISFTYTKEDGFMQEREVHERIKIYNKEGYDWATKKIYLYKSKAGANEKLRGLKGYTYNIKEGKVDEDKLKKDGIFEEQFNEYLELTTLTMPNINDGSVIEYTYKIVSPFLQIDDLYFQALIPTNKLVMSIATPQYYQYDKQMNIQAFYYPKIKEGRDNRTFTSTNTNRGEGFTATGTSFSQSKSEYFDNTIKIDEENIPAVRAEAFAGNIDNYLSKMSLELSAILTQIGTVEKALSSNWEKVSKTIYDYDSFGGELSRHNFFKKDLPSVLGGASEPFEKTAALFNYVKSKVKWNGNNGYTAQKGIKNAYKEGVGNVGDINLLLIAMLKSQGIEANPVLVSTKNNGIPLFPTRNGFNYVVCLVQDGENAVLLDATEPYCAPNILPVRALNWQGRIVKENGTSGWIPLRPSNISNTSTMLNVTLNDDASAAGKVMQGLTSHTALNYRQRYTSMSSDDHRKAIEKNKGAIEISDLAMENSKQIMEPLKLSYNYELPDAVDVIGDNIYLTPLLFMADKESPFKLDKRNYPIDFVTPFNDKYLVNIKLPENYVVDSMPQSEIIEFNNGIATYSFIGKQNGSFLQFNITLELNNSLIDPADYEIFKDFYEKIIQKQAEQVVLKKS